MELKNKEELRSEILQAWISRAWVYPQRGPEDQVFLRLSPGGRLKMRRRISELENSLGVKGADVLEQDEAGTLPVERDKIELATMVRSYTQERRFIESQGTSLGSSAVTIDEAMLEETAPEQPGEQVPE